MSTTIAPVLGQALAGRYEIVRELGAGGMATVYLARDLRHDRQVALKVLHPDLAAALGAERFLAEIRTTANLQHPHILPLHDSGEAGGLLFYVMPYVAGETLRARIAREGPLPLGDALRVAREALGALDYAHRHGVIHRDVKPENILLHDGSAMVADFGIALAVSAAGGARMTQTGLSLGTPSYMSPEQAMGERTVDARSDVYAMGAVLYEMLTGEPPFSGSTVQAIVAKVMTERPTPPSTLRDTIPAHVEASVLRALAKLPADRFASARELAEALEERVDTVGHAATRSVIRPAPRSRIRDLALIGAGLATGAAIVVGVMAMRRDAAIRAAPVTFRVDATRSEQVSLEGFGTMVAISPDGGSIAYPSSGDSVVRLLTRRLSELSGRPVPGIGDLATVSDPRYSPDGRWLYVIRVRSVVRVPVAGGAPTMLGIVDQYGGYAPVGDGIVAVGRDSLWRIDAPGATAVPIAAPNRAAGERRIANPFATRDGKLVLFSVVSASSDRGTDRLGAVGIDGKGRRDFDLLASSVVGYEDGWLFYGTFDGTVRAVQFDPVDGPRGEPTTLVEGVHSRDEEGGVSASLSTNGTLTYVRGSNERVVVLLDPTGKEIARFPRIGDYEGISWSPDGRRIAISFGREIWSYDIATGTMSRVTSKEGVLRPEWTPDGKRLVFIDDRASEVWWAPVDGSTPAERVYRSEKGFRIREVVVTPDGRHLVMRADSGSGSAQRDIHIVSIGSSDARPLVADPAVDQQPAVSPDGKWLAYASMATGQHYVYLRPMAGGVPIVVSAGEALAPRWAGPNAIVYRARGGQLALVRATLSFGAAGATVVRRETLFRDTFYGGTNTRPNFDVGPNGTIAIAQRIDESAELIAVVNWLQDVKRRLGDNR